MPNKLGKGIIVNIQSKVKIDIVDSILPFIQEQIVVQKKLAKKFADQEYRKSLHNSNADKNTERGKL